ncbi:unnamed protein product, partial [Brassica oleracea var. botrytis]
DQINLSSPVKLNIGIETENVSHRYEIENMINDGSVLPARPSIPVTPSPFVPSNLPSLPPPSSSSSTQKVTPVQASD